MAYQSVYEHVHVISEADAAFNDMDVAKTYHDDARRACYAGDAAKLERIFAAAPSRVIFDTKELLMTTVSSPEQSECIDVIYRRISADDHNIYAAITLFWMVSGNDVSHFSFYFKRLLALVEDDFEEHPWYIMFIACLFFGHHSFAFGLVERRVGHKIDVDRMGYKQNA